jgi:hypothetical protein
VASTLLQRFLRLYQPTYHQYQSPIRHTISFYSSLNHHLLDIGNYLLSHAFLRHCYSLAIDFRSICYLASYSNAFVIIVQSPLLPQHHPSPSASSSYPHCIHPLSRSSLPFGHHCFRNTIHRHPHHLVILIAFSHLVAFHEVHQPPRTTRNINCIIPITTKPCSDQSDKSLH